MNQKVYVCIGTAQNTINALPFYETKCNLDDITQVKILQSTKAKEEGWSCHLMKFVKQKLGKNFSVDYSDLKLSTVALANEFYRQTFNHHDFIVINIGGGTKAMTLNTMLAINTLDEEQRKKYTLIYPNIESRQFDIYTFDSNIAVKHLPMKVHIPLEDILTCYGEEDALIIVGNATIKPFNNAFEVETREYFYAVNDAYVDIFEEIENEDVKNRLKNEIGLAYGRFAVAQKSKLKGDWNGNTSNTMMYDTFINAYFKKDDFNKSFNPPTTSSISLSIGSKRLEVSQKAFETEYGYAKGTFFEIIVQNRATEYLTKIYGHEKCQIGYNLKPIFDSKWDKDAELDLVIDAYNGELLVFEVKSKVMEKKDFDAMRLKIQKYAGIYNQTYVLIPFYWEDFSSTVSVNRLNDLNNKYLQYLINLPFEFDKNNIKFCVLGSEKDETPYDLYRQKEYITRDKCDSKLNKSELIHEVQIVSYKTIIDQYINKNK